MKIGPDMGHKDNKKIEDKKYKKIIINLFFFKISKKKIKLIRIAKTSKLWALISKDCQIKKGFMVIKKPTNQ